MLLQAALGLAVCSLMIEGFIALKIRAWRQFAARYPIAGLPVSLFLSWWLGKLFGMEGVTVGIAAVMSTAGGIGMYLAMEYWDEHEGVCAQKWADTKMLIQDLWRVFVWFLRVITAPLRAMRWASRKYNAAHNAVTK